jgi:uncharacterized OB-fold protein
MLVPLVLDGGRCADCGVVLYPYQESCPRCAGVGVLPAPLSGTGRLWTWTVQRYPPKSPPYQPPAGGFVPFVVGYVELPEGVRVAAIVDDVPEPVIGMPLRLVSVAAVPHFAAVTDDG